MSSAPVLVETVAAFLPAGADDRVVGSRRLDERSPGGASGWASSWSSRAPPKPC